MLKFQLFLSETVPVTSLFPCSVFICLVSLPLARPPCLQLGMKDHCSVSHSSLQHSLLPPDSLSRCVDRKEGSLSGNGSESPSLGTTGVGSGLWWGMISLAVSLSSKMGCSSSPRASNSTRIPRIGFSAETSKNLQTWACEWFIKDSKGGVVVCGFTFRN